MIHRSTVEKIKIVVSAAVFALAVLPSPLPAASNSYVQDLISKVHRASQKPATKKPAAKVPVKTKVAPKKPAGAQKPPPANTSAAFTSSATAPLVSAPAFDAQAVNTKTRAAIVNILCTTRSGGTFRPISGSGVIIDPRGTILTNAHVAQYFLLKDYVVPDFVNCVIRTGSPAQAAYKAEIAYLPQGWISANATEIGKRVATGTGQHDYALLAITGTVDPAQQLPAQFPFLEPNVSYDQLELRAPVLVAGYPSELAGAITTQRDLHSASTQTHVDQAYYFNDADAGKIDLFSVGSTILAQGGSSGGAVVDSISQKLLGVIVTTTSGTTTDSKKLQAVSLPHINRSMVEHTGSSLSSFLLGDAASRVSEFKNTQFEAQKGVLVRALEAR